MLVLLVVALGVGAAHAGECALDVDADGFAGAVLQPDGDGACTAAGEVAAERAGEDCDDADPAVNPGAPERSGDTVDDDCNGVVGCFADVDRDGWRLETADPGWYPDLDCDDVGEAWADAPAPDCDDVEKATWPGAPEVVGNDFDESCDGQELCFPDRDEDGFRTEEVVASADADCDDPGEAHPELKLGDCDDHDPQVQADCVPADATLTGSGCATAPGFGGGAAFAALAVIARRRRC